MGAGFRSCRSSGTAPVEGAGVVSKVSTLEGVKLEHTEKVKVAFNKDEPDSMEVTGLRREARLFYTAGNRIRKLGCGQIKGTLRDS